jgi:hypothetical protein
VDPAERLAAYLAGDLDADEHTALEAELARDAALRGELAGMRRADAALAELSSPTPPVGFEDRLRAALAPVLAGELGSDADHATAVAAPASPTGDELAARRRQRRERPRWVPVLGGVAASLVLVAAGISAVSLLRGDDAEDGFAVTMDAMTDDAGAPEADGDGPVVVTEGRSLDSDDADDLLAGPVLDELVGRELDPATGAELAERWSAQLGADATTALQLPSDERAEGDVPDAAADDEAVEETAPAEEAAAADVDDGTAIARCLTELLGGGDAAIPAYVELATFEDRPAIVFGLVSVDPATGAFTRPEVWILDRADCQVLRFSQGSATG